jgi:carbamoylphosphate synthase large subunit
MGPADDVRFIGETGPRVSTVVRDAIADAARFDRAVIMSGHDSLRRDLALAGELRRLGLDVHAQSARAAELGLDKVALKRFFERHGFRTPVWGSGACTANGRNGTPIVVKDRHSTQSRNIQLASGSVAVARTQYWEVFTAGTEYSVLVYVEPARTITFPPVWKGDTAEDLLPPWRRLRICPAQSLSAEQSATLSRFAADVCTAATAHGYVEVEFVHAGEEFLVLEINPRVSGVMRISALAADIPLFSLHADADVEGALPARRVAVELPHDGDPFVIPERAIFATSRVTVAGRNLAEAMTTLASVVGDERMSEIDRHVGC